MASQLFFWKNIVLVDYIGIFYMRQYFWPHTVALRSGDDPECYHTVEIVSKGSVHIKTSIITTLVAISFALIRAISLTVKHFPPGLSNYSLIVELIFFLNMREIFVDGRLAIKINQRDRSVTTEYDYYERTHIFHKILHWNDIRVSSRLTWFPAKISFFSAYHLP